MKKFNKIVMSDVEPDINCIWLNNKTLLAYKNGKWVPILRGEKLPTYYIKGIVTEKYRNLNPDYNGWWKELAAQIAPELQEPMPTNEKEFYKLVDKYINVIISEQEAAGNITSEEEKEAFKQQTYAELENLKNSYEPPIAKYYLEDGSLKKLDIKKDGSFIVNLEGRQNIIPFAKDKEFLQEITASSLPKIENLSEFLREYKNLQKAKLDLSEVTKSCNRLFYNCTSLEKLELNAPNVTSAENMLYSSQNLIYAKINMPKLEVANDMFIYNHKVKNTGIDMDMSNIKQANGMFTSCTNITKVFDTPNIESAVQMYQSTGIKEVTVTYDKLINAYDMFNNCSKLVSANINLPKVVTAREAFHQCPNLTEVVLDMPKAINIENIMRGCTKLTKITLSIPKITILAYAFTECPSLRFIDLSSITNPRIIEYCSNCFYGVKNCTVKCTQAFKDFCLANKGVMALDDSVTFDVID